MPEQKLYDAFLSHNNNDKPVVEQIAVWLRDQAKLKVWFDKWNVLAGDVWQEEIEKALDQSRSCVVFLGPAGLGGWHNEEMRSAIEDRVAHKEMRVIPVLLPNTKIPEKESGLARFLRRHSYVEFRHDVNDDEALKRLAAGITGKQAGESASRLYETVCPFRGLEVFREEHKDYFFGRDNVVQRLQHYLQHHRFLAVIGPSGSGKSSVVQAGLIPSLEKSRIEDGESRIARSSIFHHQSSIINHPSSILNPRSFRSALFTPQADPFEGLAFALRPLIAQPPSYSQLIKDLADNEKELENIARGICRDTGEARLLLVIDQFEEVFTQTADEQKRQLFFASLLNTVEAANSPTLIVLTMRSDFLGKCAAYADLNTFIIDHLFQIGPMSAKDLREAIEAPAQRVGLEFEKGLVEIILRDAAGAPGELPLIEHALLELYERRHGNKLTQTAYAEIGGISGALVKRAEAEFARLSPAQQEILRKMFVLRLIQPGEGTEDTRRRATKEELLAAGGSAKEAETVLQQWTNARLLTTTRDEEKKQEIVDVAHEALIRTWPKVQDWLKDERENSRLLGLMRHATQEWLRSGKSADYLWVGAQLARTEELYAKHAGDLMPAEKEFIEEGIARRDREVRAAEAQRQKELENAQRLAQARTRGLKLAQGIAAVILLALVSVSLLYLQLRQANDETKIQLARNHWQNGRQAREQGNLLLAFHFMAEACQIAPTQNAATVFIQYISTDLQRIVLKNIWSLQANIENMVFVEDILRLPLNTKNVIFDSAGKHILGWGADSSVRLWEAENGNQIGQTMKHEGKVDGAAFDPAGKRILSWSADSSVRLWEAEGGHQIGQTMKHEGDVWGAKFDHAGKRILSWGADSTICLWEAESGHQIGRMKQEKRINGAVFDPIERCILSWSSDSTMHLYLWEIESGHQIGETIIKHKGKVDGAMFDPTGRRILSWSDISKNPTFALGIIRLWDINSGRQIGKTMMHETAVKSAMFDSAGKRILSWTGNWLKDMFIKMLTGSGVGRVFLWEAESGKQIGQTMKHQDEVNGALFDHSEQRILSWSQDGTVRLWEAESGSQLGQMMKHESSVTGAMFDSAEKHILSWGGDRVRLWETESGREIGQTMKHEASVVSAMLDPTGKHILSLSNDSTVHFWEVKNSGQIGQTMKHEKSVTGAMFDPAGKRILSWSDDGTVRLWNAETGIQIGQTMTHEKSIRGAIFDPIGKRIMSWSADSTVRLWEVESGYQIGSSMKHDGEVMRAVFDRAGKRILSWSWRGSVYLWKADSSRQIGQTMQYNATGAMFDHAEKRILSWGSDIHLWEAHSGFQIGKTMQLEKRGRFTPRVIGAMFDPTEKMILSWYAYGVIRLWETESRLPIGDIWKDEEIQGAMFDPSGKRILSWSDDAICLWDVKHLLQIGQTMKHQDIVSARFDPEGKHILSWSGNPYSKSGTVRFWDARSGFQLGQDMKHDEAVKSAMFDETGKRILSCSYDGTVRLWDAESGLQLGQAMEYESTRGPLSRVDNEVFGTVMNSATFDPTGTRILIWGDDGTVRVWEVPGDLDFPQMSGATTIPHLN